MKSMTAYARCSQSTAWGDLVWEIRVVNHRYSDISIKMPDSLRYLEPKVRDCLAQGIKRGKLEAILKYKPLDLGVAKLCLNEGQLVQLCEAAKAIQARLPDSVLDVAKLMSWPGILSSQMSGDAGLDAAVLSCLSSALTDVVVRRQAEGQRIQLALTEVIKLLRTYVRRVELRYDEITVALQSKLRSRLEVISVELNQDRFEQELVYWLNKLDIAEEVQRFNGHLSAIDRMLQGSGVLGRKLDFYLQELGREVNTMGSKLQDIDVSAAIVDMKVGIEQMREQAQNIE